MSRTVESSKWYIPLVAGTELADRSGALGQLPPGDLLGQLPSIPCYQLSGLVLWLDGASGSSKKIAAGGGIYKWLDRSGNANHALQNTPAYRPASTADGVDLKD